MKSTCPTSRQSQLCGPASGGEQLNADSSAGKSLSANRVKDVNDYHHLYIRV